MNEPMVHQLPAYLDDTYATEVGTTVIAAALHDERRWLAVRDNIVHPQGGGQPADIATVNGAASSVVRVQHEQPLIALVPELPAGELPSVGEPVSVAVDRAARLEHAALHTAGHLVDAAVRARGFRHIVSNHFPGQARIEFEAGTALEDAEGFVAAVQADVHAVIDKDLPVETYWMDGRRYVRIDEFSLDECAGTHISSLAELGDLVVRSAKVKKGRLKVGYSARYREGADRR